MYLSLYCNGSKGLFKVCVWEGTGDRTETAIFWPQTNGRQRYVFFVLLMLNWRPWDPLGLVWLSLPHLVYNCVRSLTATGTPLSWLSYIIVQRPLNRLLDLWNGVWSSPSGNNCHAVHRSLSSGASVYECTMGIFLARPISSANFRPRDFLS